jgi:hypothetical protein
MRRSARSRFLPPVTLLATTALAAGGYHLTNLLLHIAKTLLLFSHCGS